MGDFRALPSIDRLLQRPDVRDLVTRHGHDATAAALRAAVADRRAAVAAEVAGPAASAGLALAAIVAATASALASAERGSLRPVVNATGVVIHTNLGRAPLGARALDRIVQVASGYATLEYDLATGERGSRAVHAERLLMALTGAEAAVVVNNNASAMLLVLGALARGREVLISRGELVEIGGGFRVPDVMTQSGALLREVGTTNRTRLSDFTVAMGPATALVLRVHPSNFRIEGFTEQPALAGLVAAAHAAGVVVVEDLGSGNFDAASPWEPTVQASLAAGVDLVAVSGDKMLGGPQAGIVLGQKALVDRLRAHPLMRALRVDKLTYAALEGTLLEHRAGRAHDTVPVLRMLHIPKDAVTARARAVAEALGAGGWETTVVDGASAIGGGSAPGVAVPTSLVRLAWPGWSADRLEGWLRRLDPPVIARIQDGAVVLDVRTVAPEDDTVLASLPAAVTD
ncbi:MAG: L-seryl-tRNA(Sec) selenium transferase [Acidobacteria bacterium]|nr:L-seryl-tRNA(Sec) selenium transferase [Acidobacteriota bacterium]